MAAITYLLPIRLFNWFSPVLPKLLPGLSGFIGTFIPVLGALLFSFKYRRWLPDSSSFMKDWEKERFPSLSGTITILLVFLIIFIFTGGTGLIPKLVAGRSMSPSINLGDVVFVQQVKPADIKKGDVIVFKRGRMEVVHRVIDVKKTGNSIFFITKGDANRNPDPDPVNLNAVYGKVILIIPRIGWLAIPLRNILASLFG